MQATLNIFNNPFHLHLDRVQKPLTRKAKISTIVDKEKINLTKPVICYYNGDPLLRKSWSKTTIKNGDVISFVYLPRGGGGSNPLKLVLMIALSTLVPTLIPTALQGTLAGSLLSAGIQFIGSMLINALIPPPQLPKNRQQASLVVASPTYDVSAQGNQARIGQAIPVLYGRMRVFPDFAAQPYVEYENNEQYLYQLFVITQGRASVVDISIEDSPISAFDGNYEQEIIYPNGTSNLFPTAVYNSTEVNGQELDAGSPTLGAFTVNPGLTSVNKLSFDMSCPQGLFYITDEGTYVSRNVSFSLHAQKIDDNGNNVGAQILLGTHAISAASPTAIRRTYSYLVDAGRYKVSVTRTSPKDSNQRVANTLLWMGAKGYSSERINYGNVTMLALKIKATNTLSQQSSRKVNCIAHRQLPIPTYDSGTNSYSFSAPQETSSIAWALADMCRAEYGANTNEGRYNINQLMALNTVLTSRGDELNGIFDSTQVFWEALIIAARTGRIRPYIQGGIIHFVRDSLQSLPTALFTSRNIVKGSFKITYIMNSEDTADAVDIEYFDKESWKPRIVRTALDLNEPVSIPAKVRSFGITDRQQAFREGMNSIAANRYRRKEISFETELEGHIPSFGDLIAIQSDIPEWGQNSEVINYSDGTFTLNEPIEWTDGAQHFVMLRRANGSVQGPLEVMKVGAESGNQFALLGGHAILNFEPYFGHEKEKTYVTFGRSGQVVQLAKVLSITPRGNTVAISAINEDVRVHAADGTPVPLDLYNYSIPAPSVRPILRNFDITQSGSGNTPSVSISWELVPGAGRYIIETSTDNANWQTVGEVTGSTYSFIGAVGLLYVRIAAFGGVIGPYITKSIELGLVPPPANVIAGTIGSTGQSFAVSWTPVIDADNYYVEILRLGSLVRSFVTASTNFDYTLDRATADGGPWRAITVQIRAQKGSVKSITPFVLNGSNSPPSAPTLLLSPSQVGVGITVSTSLDADYAGTVIHADTTQNFTPSAINRIYRGNANFYSHVTTQTLYYKAAHFDTYGETGLNYSPEYSAQPSANPSGITVVSSLPTAGDEGDVVYLTIDDQIYTHDGVKWNAAGSGEVPDNSITSAKLVAGSVIASKISVGTLGAVSANLGVINSGNITLDPSSYIRGGQTAYGIGTGYFIGYYLGDYVMSVGNSTRGFAWANGAFTIKGDLVAGSININNKFLVDQNGNVTIRSALTGARVEQTNEVIKVYDENDILRVKLGNLSA